MTNYIKTTGSAVDLEFEIDRSSSGIKMNKEGYLVEGPYINYHKFNRAVDLNLMFPTSSHYHKFNRAFTDKELKNLTKIKEMHTQIKVVVIKVEKKQNGLIKSTKVVQEGWMERRLDSGISMELQAVKHFKIPIEDLDNIIIRKVISIDI